MGRLVFIIFLLLGISGPRFAVAGGGAVEGLEDNPADGPPFFGEAVDIRGHKPITGATVRADYGKSQSLLTSTDPEGRFRFTGFGPSIDPKTVRVSCSMKGFRLIEATQRQVSNDSGAPYHVECLMARE